MRMRRWVRGVVVGCCLTAAGVTVTGVTAAHGQNGSALTVMPQDALELVKVLTAQERDWNAGDLNGFLNGYNKSPETTFVGSSVQHGWEAMAAHYRSSYGNKEAMGTLSFSDLEPRLLDAKFAVMTGKYNLERSRKSGGNASGLFSLVFEKTDAGWKIIVDHTN